MLISMISRAMNAKINVRACQMSISNSPPIMHAISAVATRPTVGNGFGVTVSCSKINDTIAMSISD